ncbi:MAG: adenylate/guanylate cyclase domain-containing protein, partial [Anaerolineae bacterium]|nr:adenylate/guanylate cyclase domain-containing protein [Anaerolineae bacterium]
MSNQASSSPAKTSRRRHKWIISSIAFILIVVEIAGNFPGQASALERLELAFNDSSFRLRGTERLFDDIVIVAIDDESLVWVDELWPWPRRRIAEIINWLDDAGARVIALDMFLFDPAPIPEDDRILVEALANANLTVSVNQIFTTQYTITHEPPLEIYQKVLDAYGISEIERDDDAIVRAITAYKTYGGEVFYNWAFEVARLYMGVEGPSNPSLAALTFNNARVPLNQQGKMLINYSGPTKTFPSYSAAFLTLGDYPQEVFKDKIVFIGATSETLQDLYPTPFSGTNLTAGVEIVANATATVISGNYLRVAPPWMTLVLILTAAAISWSIVKNQQPIAAIFIVIGSITAYLLLRQFVFYQTGWQFAQVAPTVMFFLGVIIPVLEQTAAQEMEKRRVRGLFGQFISPDMVTQLLETQDVSSLNKRTELTILFSDIRGFTTISEKLTPEEVVALLNPYLEEMTKVIHKHGGTVDKYEGDAIIAFFGEPLPFTDHALRAAKASIEMRDALKALTDKWIAKGLYSESF